MFSSAVRWGSRGEVLEHHTHLAAPQPDELLLAHREEIGALDLHRAGRGLDEPRETAHQGRLARPGQAHHDQGLAGADLQGDVVDRGDHALALEDGGFHHALVCRCADQPGLRPNILYSDRQRMTGSDMVPWTPAGAVILSGRVRARAGRPRERGLPARPGRRPASRPQVGLAQRNPTSSGPDRRRLPVGLRYASPTYTTARPAMIQERWGATIGARIRWWLPATDRMTGTYCDA